MKIISILLICLSLNCCPYIIKTADHGLNEYVTYKHIEHIDTINPPNVKRYYYWERECQNFHR